MTAATPDDLAIHPRRIDFELPNPLPKHWHGGDPFKSHFFNSMSILFPDGERFFIDSVRYFRDRVEDPRQRELIKGFIGQEGHHSREHIEYNRLLEEQGYDVKALTEPVRQRIRFANKHFTPERRLANTVAMEHFTAIMADAVLREMRWFDGAIEPMRQVWRWHALEETEHKAVAFDLYMQVCGDRAQLRRAMRLSTFFFLRDVTRGVWHMMKRDGRLSDVGTWYRGIRWLWGRTGFFSGLWGAYRDFYRDDFHPWQHDNQRLMQAVQQEFDSINMLGTKS
ncbi:metal-dependent hydrolase [Halopseudomonas oceani]|uniref:metal-dependent hydrolase n=1 Tax=Halopseudomonas oceani TaxID=1708783 RepID=UPI002AA918D0|nr:metal-dependent hydrolase [Halopseudomonas oceani]